MGISYIKICALILAAGQGKRYGCPKIRAEIAGQLFAERIIDSLQEAGITDYAIVVSNNDFEFATGRFDFEKLLMNHDPQSDMLASVKIGIKHCLDYAGVIIWPVDFPLVKPESLKLLVNSFRANPNQVIKPAFAERGGHPIVLPQGIFQTILDSNSSSGLKEILHKGSFKIIHLPVDDPGSVENLNYPAVN